MVGGTIWQFGRHGEWDDMAAMVGGTIGQYDRHDGGGKGQCDMAKSPPCWVGRYELHGRWDDMTAMVGKTIRPPL